MSVEEQRGESWEIEAILTCMYVRTAVQSNWKTGSSVGRPGQVHENADTLALAIYFW